MYHAAAGFEPQQHLVARLGNPYHGAHLFTQGGHLLGIHAAVKIDDEQPAAGIFALGPRLVFGLARLLQLLALRLAGQRSLQLVTSLLQLAGEIGHYQLPLRDLGWRLLTTIRMTAPMASSRVRVLARNRPYSVKNAT